MLGERSLGLELRFEEDEEEGVTCDGVGRGHEEDGSEFFKRGFHWLNW